MAEDTKSTGQPHVPAYCGCTYLGDEQWSCGHRGGLQDDVELARAAERGGVDLVNMVLAVRPVALVCENLGRLRDLPPDTVLVGPALGHALTHQHLLNLVAARNKLLETRSRPGAGRKPGLREIMPISARVKDALRLSGQNAVIYNKLCQGPTPLSDLAAVAKKYTGRVSDIRAWLRQAHPEESIVCVRQEDTNNNTYYLLPYFSPPLGSDIARGT